MSKRTTISMGDHRIMLAFILAVMSVFPGLALAQDVSSQDGWDHARMRHQIREHIGNDPGMTGPQREQVMNNFDICVQQGMAEDQVQVLFPAEGGRGSAWADHMLAMQEHVLGLVDNDLPVNLMLEKIMEGHTKHVPPVLIDRVLAQTGHNIRFSRGMMMGAIEGGVHGPRTDSGLHEANCEFARCLWDGLTEQGLEQLQEHARYRAQVGTCTMGEFVAAAQAATQFAHHGIDHDQAIHIAGEAMHAGYSAAEMRTLGYMMMSGHGMAGQHSEMMDHMHEWIGEGMSMDEMTQHMMEGGWMGPADMMGAGGHHDMDNMGWSGPGHDGDMHDDGHDHGDMHGDGHDHGGMGGGDGGHTAGSQN